MDRLRDTGQLAGTEEALAHSERAERNEPRLRTHDRYGNRIDEVELDPSWHWCLRQAIEQIHSLGRGGACKPPVAARIPISRSLERTSSGRASCTPGARSTPA